MRAMKVEQAAAQINARTSGITTWVSSARVPRASGGSVGDPPGLSYGGIGYDRAGHQRPVPAPRHGYIPVTRLAGVISQGALRRAAATSMEVT